MDNNKLRERYNKNKKCYFELKESLFEYASIDPPSGQSEVQSLFNLLDHVFSWDHKIPDFMLMTTTSEDLDKTIAMAEMSEQENV